MDAVKFIKERDRMFEVAKQAPSLCYRHEKSAEEIVREVEVWSAAHPCETRQSVFLKQYPEAAIGVYGVLQICPMAISDAYRDSNGECVNPTKRCSDCQREFWMQEAE